MTKDRVEELKDQINDIFIDFINENGINILNEDIREEVCEISYNINFALNRLASL